MADIVQQGRDLLFLARTQPPDHHHHPHRMFVPRGRKGYAQQARYAMLQDPFEPLDRLGLQ
jgi:hypothetical protein